MPCKCFQKCLHNRAVPSLGCNQKEGCLDPYIAVGWEAVEKVTDQTKIPTLSIPAVEQRKQRRSQMWHSASHNSIATSPNHHNGSLVASVVAAVHDAACRRTGLIGDDVGEDHDTVTEGGSGNRKHCLFSIRRVAARDCEWHTELENIGSSLTVSHSRDPTTVDMSGFGSVGCCSLVTSLLDAPVRIARRW